VRYCRTFHRLHGSSILPAESAQQQPCRVRRTVGGTSRLPHRLRDLFPVDLVPVAKHELVAGLRPELFRRLLIQQLYRYLHFTAKLEFMVVNYGLFCCIRGSGSAWEGGSVAAEVEHGEGDEVVGVGESEGHAGDQADLGVG
jgi:hypothetical protein